MRIVIAGVALVLTACAGAPSCKEAVRKASKRFAAEDRAEVVTLIGTCEQESWSAGMRACFAAAATADKLVACLPLPDLAKALPPVEPSAATKQRLVETGSEPVKALLFFAEDNPLGAVARTYFERLGMPSEVRDRFADYELAGRYKVARDATVVLVRGERSESLVIDTDLVTALEQGQLEHFDQNVEVAVSKLVRPVLRAYLVAGHGEVTDADSGPPAMKRGTTALTKRLEDHALQVAQLAPAQLAKDVPADATLVVWLRPLVAPSAAEWAALGRYVNGGGHLLIALDPSSPVGLGPLAHELGVRFIADHLADDKTFAAREGKPEDHGVVVTDKFSAHPSMTGLRRSVDGLMLVDAGRLERQPASASGLAVTSTIQTPDSTFVDANRNYTLDGDEQRGVYNVAMAVERDKLRAVVFSDVDLFVDTAVRAGDRVWLTLIAGPLFDDTVRWLVGFDEFPSIEVKPPSGAVRDALHDLASRRAVREVVRAFARGSEH